MNDNVNINIKKVGLESINDVLNMQKLSFKEYLYKYDDSDFNPCNQTIKGLMNDILSMDVYLLSDGHNNLGYCKVINCEELLTYEIHEFGIIPEYRKKHIGRKALLTIINNYPTAKKWIVKTMLQEKKNIAFYEKIGFKLTNKEPECINEKLSIVELIYKK